MKKLVLLIALLAAPVVAQETYTVNALAGAVALIESGRVESNRVACAERALPATCTQAEADAVRPGAVIYPATQAGRERYFRFYLRDTMIAALAAEDARRRKATFCAANQTHVMCE